MSSDALSALHPLRTRTCTADVGMTTSAGGLAKVSVSIHGQRTKGAPRCRHERVVRNG